MAGIKAPVVCSNGGNAIVLAQPWRLTYIAIYRNHG